MSDPRDADPLDVEPDDSRLLGFREQRRRSRWGCSVALIAIVAALVVFWAGVFFVAVNVFAAPSSGVQPAQAGKAAISAVKADAGLLSGAPYRVGGEAAWQVERESRPVPEEQQYGAPLSTLTYTGIVNYAQPSHGRWYLAIPNGPGWRVRICGPAGCLDRTSTDAGPSLAMQRAGKIADLNSVDWQQISGVSLRYGGFQGTVLVLGRARLPETDTR